jgi:hypothetical protein
VIEGDDLELLERSLRSATEQHSHEALDTALADIGWNDALVFDPRAAVSRLFEMQGEAAAASSALDQVVAFALGMELDGATSVLLPAVGAWEAPATSVRNRLTVRGTALAPRPAVLVVARGEDAHVAAIVETSSLDARPVRGMDPQLRLVEVHGEVDARDRASVNWTAGVALGRLAVAHELVGASRKALALAREHALERVQFGQPIARFQAVRHRLAETLVALETASALLDAAWSEQSPVSAAMAKATAGRSARAAARHCQQVLAGIGFTKEHELHRYVRRILVLDQLFGSHTTLTRRLGEDLLATKTLPPLLPL